jgi:hypothetical protein
LSLAKGSIHETPLEIWRAIRRRWNEKNTPSEEDNEPGSKPKTMVFKNTD